jgi:sugar phosphate isomerase/epimerase
VVAVPGRVSALIQPPRKLSEGWLADGLAQLLALAEDTDQRIFLENHPQAPIPTAGALDGLVRAIGHPRLQVLYDVANAEFVGEDQVPALRRLAPLLGQVHLSDGSRERWGHDRIGLGTVDFPAILRTLREIESKGARVLEIVSPTPLEDMSASLELLERAE